jgi:hypothetical protein
VSILVTLILANLISSQLKKLLAKSSKKLSFASLSLAQIKGGVEKEDA